MYPNIEAERARAGKTKQKLAIDLEINSKTLQNWQNGKYPIPADKLLRMRDIFGCSVDYLLGCTRERSYADTNNPPADQTNVS